MLEPPPIPHQHILTRLAAEYGLHAAQVTFLPIGADTNTAVYRVDAADGAPYFLKLRKGAFDPAAVEVPHLLETQGSAAIRAAIIAPLETIAGRLYGNLAPYQMILYPYIEGRDGYQVELNRLQWTALGAALRGLHEIQLPAALAARIPRETYSAQNRVLTRRYLAQVETEPFTDPTARNLAAFMRARRDTMTHMLDRCDALGRALQARPLDFVLCHADIHPGNLHLTPAGHLYLVDWDNLLFAPKERDLMSIGAGMGSDRGQGETPFYHGYYRGSYRGYCPEVHPADGPIPIDRAALAYYRYERIIADFAAYGDQLLASTAGGPDREQAYQYFTSNFLPGNVIEVAFRTDEYWMK